MMGISESKKRPGCLVVLESPFVVLQMSFDFTGVHPPHLRDLRKRQSVFFFPENLVDLQMIWCGVTHGLILILKLLKIMIRMDFPWYSQSPGKIHDRFDWRKGNNCKNNMIPGSYPCLSFEIYWSKPGKFPITSGTCRTSWSGFLWGTESFR